MLSTTNINTLNNISNIYKTMTAQETDIERYTKQYIEEQGGLVDLTQWLKQSKSD